MQKIFSRSYHISSIANGRPFRKPAGPAVIHGSQKPAESAHIDFQALGLKYPLKFDLTRKDFLTKTFWTPPPKEHPNLPFFVERTDVGGFLPVYTDYKGGGTKVVTMIRKCKGDIQELKSEVEKVVGRTAELRPGKIIVNGNFHGRLKVWLTLLGF
eukprot:gene16393-22346_t